MEISKKVREISESIALEQRISSHYAMAILLCCLFNLDPKEWGDNRAQYQKICAVIQAWESYGVLVKYSTSDPLSGTHIRYRNQIAIFTSEIDKDEQSHEDSWVIKEYIPLFKEANPSIVEGKRETCARMREFRSTHPKYSKQEILESVKLYIRNTEAKYLRRPYYFIKKKVGGLWESELLSWLEKYEDLQRENPGNSPTNTLT